MSRNLGIAIAVIILIIAGLIFVRGAVNQNPSPSPIETTVATPAESAAPSESASPSAQTSQNITVVGNEFAFTPATFSVKMGQSVTLTFKNEGKFAHNLTIADLNVATKTIQPGQSDTVTFTPTKTGSFGYSCTVDSHAARGMKGTLTVQ